MNYERGRSRRPSGSAAPPGPGNLNNVNPPGLVDLDGFVVQLRQQNDGSLTAAGQFGQLGQLVTTSS